MDNNNSSNKKSRQGNSNAKACQSSDSNRKSDSQLYKPWPRNSKRREQSTSSRNDLPPQQRQTKQNPAGYKTRLNADKRPRARGYGNNNIGIVDGVGIKEEGANDNATASGIDDLFTTSTGLDEKHNSASILGGALGKNQQKRDYELNSVYVAGSKKQNLNHLLNFHYAPREFQYSVGNSVFGRGGHDFHDGGFHHKNSNGKKPKYNKEQFLQANFQFVVNESSKSKLTVSPDTLIDWNLIEQINIQSTEEPQCPICLYPPIAAKLTRCGHAYCWPCILHYSTLNEKTWSKCPICYEAIHVCDLKSTTIVQQKHINVGNEITFHLMRRKKGSMLIEKFESSLLSNTNEYPYVSTNDESKLFSKFLIAKQMDILNIIEREKRELITGADQSSPEFEYVQEALNLLQDRRKKLGSIDMTEEENNEKTIIIDGKIEQQVNEKVTELEASSDGIMETESYAESFATSSTLSDDFGGAMSKYDKFYYFYQAVDGQNVFLHPLNVKMLRCCYGSLEHAPLVIKSKILQKEYHSMDEAHRKKFTCLSHLPLTCQFAIIEVKLEPPIVTEAVVAEFKSELQFRQKQRVRRERDENKREKKINEINDRQMGKLIASTANLNLNSVQEFPTCGFEEPLPAPSCSFVASNNVGKRSATDAVARPTSYSVAVQNASPLKEFGPPLGSPQGHNYHVASTWGRNVSIDRRLNHNSECESIDSSTVDGAIIKSSKTTLNDVLAVAISKKNQNANTKELKNGKKNSGGNTASNNDTANNKKNKKNKKMLPLYSTSMNNYSK